jgi:soluble lytic murein transglycosylase-like protein
LKRFSSRMRLALLATGLASATGMAHAAEHITLANGFDLTCDHRDTVGDRVRLYLSASDADFVEVNPTDITSSEHVDLPVVKDSAVAPASGPLKAADLKEMLSEAGEAHNLDADLLASVVRQESGGNAHALSRTGARGLMQLMPGTATQMGVSDAFAPRENVNGGTAYLDAMLRRYHDNLALALAAYNAGPAAVDRWHGIPPYRETRAYVARVIHEFNRRVDARRRQIATAKVAAAVTVIERH